MPQGHWGLKTYFGFCLADLNPHGSISTQTMRRCCVCAGGTGDRRTELRGGAWQCPGWSGQGRVPVGHGLLNPSFYWLLRLFYLACTILCNVNKSPL